MSHVCRWVLVFSLVPAAAAAADPVRWRGDYSAARKEAADGGLPLCLYISSEQCVYCRKMEGGPLTDPAVTGLLGGGQFVPVKLDGNKDAVVARALRVQVYPTTVLAGPDGTIHAVLQGFVSADQLRDALKKAQVASADDVKLARELADATAAAKAGDYAKALAVAQRVALVGKGKPAEPKATEIIEDIEKSAADRLSASRDDAALAGVVRVFPGTRAAARAEASLTAAGKAIDVVPPRAILAAARKLADRGEYAEALDLLGFLARGPENVPETAAAGELAKAIKTDPAKLTTAAKQATEKAAALQITLSEAYVAQGRSGDAAACLDEVLKLCPTGPKAEYAAATLRKLRGDTVAVPAVRTRD